ncbi:MAG: hypothetical protein HOW73_29895 [Polyangiaceae bacterium]|nr:hypothetical protein [Polyangiaceae bacterium]
MLPRISQYGFVGALFLAACAPMTTTPADPADPSGLPTYRFYEPSDLRAPEAAAGSNRSNVFVDSVRRDVVRDSVDLGSTRAAEDGPRTKNPPPGSGCPRC